LKHRLFIAIDIPDPVRTEIASLQHQLDDLGLPVVWEDPKKLHLTLHFLGSTPNEQMLNLMSALRKELHTFSAFSLTPYFLETLYKRHEPSLIYVGLQGDLEALKLLQRSLGDLLTEFRLPAQNKFLPHITIGRLKRDDPVNTKLFLDKIDIVDIKPLSTYTVDNVVLYESHLSKQGSFYQKLATFAFAV
jgi:RNA 2',3'-cyclic 3'-phosphodiesterase